jgi:hypothetical protein
MATAAAIIDLQEVLDRFDPAMTTPWRGSAKYHPNPRNSNAILWFHRECKKFSDHHCERYLGHCNGNE